MQPGRNRASEEAASPSISDALAGWRIWAEMLETYRSMLGGSAAGSGGDGGRAVAALATLARRHPGWRLGVLLPDDRAALRALSLRPPRARHALDNGGLRVWLNLW